MTDEERLFADQMTVCLTAAREKFYDFYNRANEAEVLLFDSLLMSRIVVGASLVVSGRNLDDVKRRTFERDTIAIEQMFTDFREKVRASRAFQGASPATRSLIERDVFEVGPVPLSEIGFGFGSADPNA